MGRGFEGTIEALPMSLSLVSLTVSDAKVTVSILQRERQLGGVE